MWPEGTAELQGDEWVEGEVQNVARRDGAAVMVDR